MLVSTLNTIHIQLSVQILKSVSYFDIFSHPLNKKEIEKLCRAEITQGILDDALDELVESKKLHTDGSYYSIRAEVEELVKTRMLKEANAKSYLEKLPFYTRLIKAFPFVRAIAISGSLSKSVMHEDGDIDYFIITKPGRLWISRSFLILFKKLVLMNSRKYFCVNYFVDENNMEIIDKNMFTAMEIAYLAPVYNPKLVDSLKSTNDWTADYVANFRHPLKLETYEGNGLFKRGVEKLFSGKLGDHVDLYLMKLTYNRWKKKFKDFNPEKFELTMRTNRGVSKHHPRDFQNRVLSEYQHRLDQLGLVS